MKRTLSEKRVLKKLGIVDFRHMTKEKVVKFASMLPYMDPEIAKKALEQFPAFKDLASDLVTEYKNIVDRILSENTESQRAFYDACNSIIATLQAELSMENISSEDRQRIENEMISVARMIGEKDSENKKFLWTMALTVGTIFVGIIGTAASLLGSNSQYSDESDTLLPDEDELDDIGIEEVDSM